MNLQLDEKREKRKEKPKLVPELPISEPCEATVLRGSVERERERERDVWERWHPDSHRHRKLPRSSFAFWGWRAWLGPNTFYLTKNLLFFSHLKRTYLLAHKVSPPSPWGDGGPTVVTPPPPSPPPPPSFCARNLTSAARSRDHEEGSSKAEKELHSLAKL
jgi:hypothetical protein